jgi:hypothetical protein
MLKQHAFRTGAVTDVAKVESTPEDQAGANPRPYQVVGRVCAIARVKRFKGDVGGDTVVGAHHDRLDGRTLGVLRFVLGAFWNTSRCAKIA